MLEHISPGPSGDLEVSRAFAALSQVMTLDGDAQLRCFQPILILGAISSRRASGVLEIVCDGFWKYQANSRLRY